jgi:membrane protease YdiL (CAAX protease family)
MSTPQPELSVDGTGPQASGRRPAPDAAGRTMTAAWVVVVLVSAAPAIVLSESAGGVPSWLTVAQLGVLAAVFLVGLGVPVVRPLRRWAVVMAAVQLLLAFLPRLELEWSGLQSLFGGTVFDARMQSEQTGKLIVTSGVLAVLLSLGFRRKDFFLTTGDLHAPIRPVRVLGFPRPDPWWKFGLVWAAGIAAGLAVALFMSGRPAVGLDTLLHMAPSILFYAALNAFSEEMTYRAPMLATLEPAVGSAQALGMSAVFFGVAHYFGTPGGLLGALLSVFMGWILGKAMVETRGLFWPWFMHFLSDVVIFGFLAASLVA